MRPINIAKIKTRLINSLGNAASSGIELKIAKSCFKATLLQWLEDNSLPPLSDTEIRKRLENYKVTGGHSGPVKEWHGIALKKEEPAGDPEPNKVVLTAGTKSDTNGTVGTDPNKNLSRETKIGKK